MHTGADGMFRSDSASSDVSHYYSVSYDSFPPAFRMWHRDRSMPAGQEFSDRVVVQLG